MIFLADIRLGQCVGDLLEMWFKERFGAATQHCSQHHEGGPGVGGRGWGCHMIQQQLEEDCRRDKGPQQFSSCQALVVGTKRVRRVKRDTEVWGSVKESNRKSFSICHTSNIHRIL